MAGSETRLVELFAGAQAIAPAQREAWLLAQCGGDPALWREVQELLAHADGEDERLDGAATALRSLAEATFLSPVPAGQQIGGYVVQGVLASGGMGTVYLAEQQSPRRRVALKVLAWSLEGGEAERRFLHESRILAHLRHPGIAQVYDCGAWEREGRAVPWFAMEFVEDARWITVYARELPLAAKLALFAQVCDAVHHGHCKGVVHRDLKPANILVDGQGRPRVIDFGVAKARDGELGDSLVTLQGQIVGTVGYMSPEQAQGDSAAIDTRSDVYSLGVVLYELLTGKLPYATGGSGLVAAARTVCEVAPDRTALHGLPADLRTIVLEALHKEPQRRYGSAAAMAADLGRFLRKEPIAARAVGTWYLLTAFTRRNRLLVATAALLLLALLGGSVGTGIGLWRASRAQAAAQWGRDFLVAMLYDADPWSGRGPRATLEMALRVAVLRLEHDLPEPAVEADMRAVIGEVLAKIGEPQGAETQLRAAIALFERLGDPDPERLVRLRAGLALCLCDLGRGDEAQLLADDLAATGPVGGSAWLRLQNLLGRIRATRGDHAGAAAGLQAAIAVAQQAPAADEVQLESLRHNLALSLRALGRFDDAVATLRQVLQQRVVRVGEHHPESVLTRGNLAAVLIECQQLQEASGLLQQVRADQARLFGGEDRRTLATENNLALLYRHLGRLQDAERLGRQVLAARRRTIGTEANDTLTTQANLAVVLVAAADLGQGDTAAQQREAEQLLVDVLAGRERTESEPSAERARAHDVYGNLLLGQGRVEAAHRHFESACRIAAATLDDARFEPWMFRAGEAAAAYSLGDRASALLRLDRCIEELTLRLGADSEVVRSVVAWREKNVKD